jgi:hypothetical protein
MLRDILQGLTSAYGKWAVDLKTRLSSAGLTCHVLSEHLFLKAMYEKHMWICAVMPIGAKMRGTVSLAHFNVYQDCRAFFTGW